MTRTEPIDCDRIQVYGTEGDEFYPNPSAGTKHAEARQWYMQGLRGYVDTAKSQLMVYLGDIRHERELDQAFVVFDWTDLTDIFSDCGTAVKHCLESERNWRVLDTTNSASEKSLYNHLVGTARSGNTDRIRIADHTRYESDVITEVLTDPNTKPLRVVVPDYRMASDLLRTYARLDNTRIHIYNDDITPPDGVDLAIGVQSGQSNVHLPEVTLTRLDRYEEQLEQHRRDKRSQVTIDAVTDHAQNDDDLSVVKNAIQEGLRRGYGEYRILSEDEYSEKERKLSQYKTELEELRNRVERLNDEMRRKDKTIRRLKKKSKVTASLPLGSSNPADQSHHADGISGHEPTESGRSGGSLSRNLVKRGLLFLFGGVVIVGIVFAVFGYLFGGLPFVSGGGGDELIGVVQNSSKEPIEGAKVSIEGTNITAETNETGVYSLSTVKIADDKINVNVTADGFQPQNKTIDLTKSSQNSTFTLQASSQPNVTVQTLSPDKTAPTEVTLRGKLVELRGVKEANVSFRWREIGTEDWKKTSKTVSSEGEFNTTISDLSPGTKYEFQVSVKIAGATDNGSLETFETDTGTEQNDTNARVALPDEQYGCEPADDIVMCVNY